MKKIYSLSLFSFFLLFANLHQVQAQGLVVNEQSFNNCGRTASINVRGGVAPYTYTWSYDGVVVQVDDNLPAGEMSRIERAFSGNYTLVVTDSGNPTASLTTTINFSENTSFDLIIEAEEQTECNGTTLGRVFGQVTGGVPNYLINIYLEGSTNVFQSWSVPTNNIDFGGVPAGRYLVEVIDNNGLGCKEYAEIDIPEIPEIVYLTGANLGAFPETCDANGSIAYDITSSSGPVEFRIVEIGSGDVIVDWTPVINGQIRYTGLTRGDYRLEITDDFRTTACPESLNFTIQDQRRIDVQTIVNPVACFNGSDGEITVSVGRIYNLGSGNPQNVRITITNNGTGEVKVNNDTMGLGSPSSLTRVNRTYTGFEAGTYTVVVIQGGNNSSECELTFQVTVTAPVAPITATFDRIRDVTCIGGNDGRIRVNPTGGWGGYTYFWVGLNNRTTREVNNLSAGTYTVRVTDREGCTAEFSYTINEPTQIQANFTNITALSCAGANDGSATVNPSGGWGAPYTYLWSNGQTGQTATNLVGGNNTVIVTDSRGCARTFTVSIPVPDPAAITYTPVAPNCFAGADGSIRVQIADATSTAYSVRVNGVTQNGKDVTFNGLAAGDYEVEISFGANCKVIETVTVTEPTQITIDDDALSIENIRCFGESNGSISGLVTTGGTGILSYQWQNVVGGVFTNISGATNPDINGLVAGTYRLVVTDANGCFINRNFTISQPQVLQASITEVTNLACFGENNGQVRFNITGGTAPYTYSLNGGAAVETFQTNITISDLAASQDNFITIEDANGCTVASLEFDIIQPDQLVIQNPVITKETCFGAADGSITVDTEGGSGNLAYEWYNLNDINTVLSRDEDLLNVGPGTYRLFVIDEDNPSCVITRDFVIEVTPDLVIGLVDKQNVLCFGEATGAININVSGGTLASGNAYTFSWTGPGGFTANTEDISGLVAGLYTVTVRDDNNCQETLANIEITQPATRLDVTVISQIDPKCFDSADGRIEVQSAGGTPNYTYAWEQETSPGVYTPVGANSRILNGIARGTYRVNVTDANGCITTETITLTAPDELIATIVEVRDISCFGRNDGFIDISVVGGTAPYRYSWDYGFNREDAVNLSAGTYSVTITDANNCSVTLADIVVDEPDALGIDLVQITNDECFTGNGSIEINLTGGIAASRQVTWTRLSDNTVISTQTGVSTSTVSGLEPGFYRVDYTTGGSCTISRNYRVEGPAQPLQVFGSPQDASCAGETGIIFLSATGGQGPYTFAIETSPGVWTDLPNTIAGGIPAGTYNIRVTDGASCVATNTIEVMEPNPPIISASVEQDVSCFGGNDGVIDYNVSGSTNIQWFRRNSSGADILIPDSELNSLFAGTYYMRVTYASNCTVTSGDYVVEQPAEVVITPQVTMPVCNGDFGFFEISVSGGAPGKTIRLTGDNGFSEELLNQPDGTYNFPNLLPGTYTWEVVDAGCGPRTNTFIIEDITEPSFTISKDDVSCFGANDGGFEVESPIVHSGRSYIVWVNGTSYGAQTVFTGLSAGNYSVILQDNEGCESTPFTFTIDQPASPLAIEGLEVDQVLCFGTSTGAVRFSISGGRANYTATLTNLTTNATRNLSGITEGDERFWDALSAGNYRIDIADLNGVCTTSQTFTITQPAAFTATRQVGVIQCAGGTTFIDLNVTGGTQPYVYTWERNNGGTWEVISGETSDRVEGLVAGTYRYTVTEANSCNVLTEEITIADGTEITVSGTSSPILCFGGSTLVTLTGSGAATNNYTYFVNGSQIFGNQFQARAGDYEVYAVDNVKGCVSATVTVTVTQPAAPLSIVTYEQDNLSCFEANDGVIRLQLSGGTAPYSVNFNGSVSELGENELGEFTGLVANQAYVITVEDANGCEISLPSRTLTQPLPLQAQARFNPITCFGGTTNVTLDVTGGNRPYAGGITWEYSTTGASGTWGTFGQTGTSLTGVSAGFYRYTVNDAFCPITNTFEIEQPAEVNLTAATTPVTCFGGMDGTVTFEALGGPSGTYRYFIGGSEVSRTVTGLAAGTYTAYTLSGSCRSADITFTVGGPASPLSAVVSAPSSVACFGDLADINIALSGGNGGYAVSVNGTPVTVVGNNVSLTDYAPGTYSVLVTDSKGCTFNTSFTIAQPAQLVINQLQIRNETCFESNDGGVNVEVSGGTGILNYSWTNQSGAEVSTNINLENATAGTYTLTVTDANACTVSRDFVIEGTTPVDFTFVSTNVSCNGGNNGSVTFSASGGRGGYKYYIDDVRQSGETVSNLRAGTYSLVVRDVNNCISAVKTVTITQPDELIFDVQQTNVTCFGANNGSANLVIRGGTAPYAVRWSDRNTDQNRSGMAPGTYEVTVTDANGCTYTDIVEITQPTQLTIDRQITDVLCFGAETGKIELSVSGSNGGYTYSWTRVGSPTVISTAQNLENVAAGNYRVVVTDRDGCSTAREYTINQPAAGLEVEELITNITCFGNTTGRIDLIVNGGAGGYTYQWSSGETTRSISNKPAGNYTVQITDANGCTFSETYAITQPDELLVNADITNVLCFGDGRGSISLDITGGTGAYDILWSNGATTPTLSNLRGGSYSVVIFDENGCSFRATYEVIEPSAALQVTGDVISQQCNEIPDMGVMLTVQGGTAPYSYRWSNGSTSQNISAVPAGEYTVTVTDANGCEVTQTYDIPEPSPAMTLEIDGKLGLCNGAERGNINLTVNGGAAPYRFAWSNGATTQNLNNLGAGTYSVTVTDANGCIATETVEILPPGNLSLSLAELSQVSCFGANDGQIAININGGRAPFQITWNDDIRLDQPVISNLAPGLYRVRVVDANGCQAVSVFNITEPEILTFTAQQENITCKDANDGRITLNVQGGNAPYSYAWSNGSTVRNQANLAPGTYSVVITDARGCSTGASYTITEPAKALTIDSEATESMRCFGEQNGAISIRLSGGTQPYSLQWEDGSSELSRENLGAGVYKVIVTDGNGCIAEKTFNITEPEELRADFIPIIDVNCDTRAFTAAARVEVTGGTGEYHFDWSIGRTGPVSELSNLPEGPITVIVTDSNGCQVTVSGEIKFPDLAMADFTYEIEGIGGPENKISVQDLINFIDLSEGEIVSWSWTFGDGNGDPEQNPSHVYEQVGTYTVTLEILDQYGCRSLKQVELTVGDIYTFLVPNAFTPNGDGINDYFLPKVKGISELEFWVFNKWGELLFYSNDLETKGWDGTVKGKSGINGNYVYKAKFKTVDGRTINKEGVFLLIL